MCVVFQDGSTQQHIENLLTPGICQDLISTHEDNLELADKTQCTPFQEHYDSDKSVVEETPQKLVDLHFISTLFFIVFIW